jgi:hypothetical protein
MNYSPEDSLIISGLKLNPSEKDLSIIENCIPEIKDWDSYTENIIRNGIAPLMYKNITSTKSADKVPDDALSRLKQAYYKILGRNVFLIEKFRIIHKLFSDQGIEVIALKGIYLSEAVYKDIGLRPMSDIDLLVHREDAEKCQKLLKENGFVDENIAPSNFIKNTEKHLAPLVKDGVSVEIHVKLHNEQYGYSINTDDFWKNSRLIQLHGVIVRTLSPNDLLQHLCIHFDSHNNVSDIQLRWYGDLVNVLEFFCNEIDWKLFEESCKLRNCAKNIFKSLLLLKKYFEAVIPDDVIERNQHFYDKDAEDLFFKVLHLDKEEISKKKRDYSAGRNIGNLRRVKGFRNKFIFLIGDIFPSKSFMYQNYRIKHKSLVYFYYLKRLLIGIYKLLILAKNKLLSGKN